MAEIVVHDEQIALPVASIENIQEDSTSNLNPGHAEQTVSKSRTSSLGKMFQKMRLSEVRLKLKKEGGTSTEKISEVMSKTASATESSTYKKGLKASESVDGEFPIPGSKTAIDKRASLPSNETVSNKGRRNYLGSWNACWQKPPNSDDISESEYQSSEVLKEQSICADCDIVKDDVLKEVPLRPMSPTNADVEQK